MGREALLKRIKDRRAQVGVVGMGYVGLPLAVEFGRAGFRVLGVDPQASKVEKLNRGASYIPDVPSEQVAELVQAGRLRATGDYAELRAADAVLICVPTPLRKTRDPDMSYIYAAVDALTPQMHREMVVVLESTTYPGTTEEVLVPRLTGHNGFTVGEDVFIAFSPERVDPGNKTYGTRNTPKVVGGMTPACQEVAVALYSAAVDTIVPVSSTRAAEMVKLLENTFRAVNIGLPFYPGPGLGGHCIPIDPLYLSWKLKSLNYNARFIELASEINTAMPLYVVGKVADALNDAGKAVRGSTIAVLGVAYKRDIDDVRESPALDIIHLLEEKGARVSYHDPYIPSVRLEGDRIMNSQPLTAEWLGAADIVVWVTDHSCFDRQWLLDHSRLVMDTRNAAKGLHGQAKVVGL